MVRPPAAGAEISARESAVSFWPLFSLCYQCLALGETRIGDCRMSRRCGHGSSRCGPRGLVGEFLPPRTICSSFRSISCRCSRNARSRPAASKPVGSKSIFKCWTGYSAPDSPYLLASIERHCLGVDLPPEVRFELDCHGRPHSYGRRGARSDSLRFRTDSLKPQSSSAALALLPWHGLAGLGTLIAFA